MITTERTYALSLDLRYADGPRMACAIAKGTNWQLALSDKARALHFADPDLLAVYCNHWARVGLPKHVQVHFGPDAVSLTG